VLTGTETQASITATDAYAVTVQSLAEANGLAFADLRVILSEAATSGAVFDEFNMTTDLIFGGLVGLDGVHLTARGYAYMANKFLEAIDATYGSNFGASGSMLRAANFVPGYSGSL
jgi:lysophospholipase L1-like esterase